MVVQLVTVLFYELCIEASDGVCGVNKLSFKCITKAGIRGLQAKLYLLKDCL